MIFLNLMSILVFLNSTKQLVQLDMLASTIIDFRKDSCRGSLKNLQYSKSLLQIIQLVPFSESKDS